MRFHHAARFTPRFSQRYCRRGTRCLAGTAAAMLLAACGLAGAMDIVREGTSRAVVVLAADANESLRQAAETLVSSIHTATGVSLDLVAMRPAQGNAICIGHIPGNAFPHPDQAGLDDDGFDITFPDEHTVLILGPSDWGTEFGIYEFLERFVGVRWLLPGPDGVDIPSATTLTAQGPPIRQQPAFFSRLFSGLSGRAQSTWARRNRMHGRVSFHHNLIRLFPPETYTESHPEFFPLRKGERFLPASNTTHGWQPCFSAPGLVDEAVRNITAYFAENPSATSYSLGTNDSSGYCECDACLASVPEKDNFLGRRDYSDLYYRWANQVIERVLETHPDKVFGCLAYSEVAAPPQHVDVHPRLIPFLTYDRMKWIEPEIRATGEETTRQWHRKSPTIGWYDYIYGTPFVLPRVWFHHMADYYRFGLANGVRALYAEAYPNWGEGPKLYVSLKLQWDPQGNVDELLDEWYRRCVGEAAAPYLARYYAHWEDFWTRRILDSTWFTKGGQYLRFSTPDYLRDVDGHDIAQSRGWLGKAVELAETPPQKARAALLLRAFEYYEATAYAYKTGHELAEGPITRVEDALAILATAGKGVEFSAKRRRLALEEFPDHPVLVHPLTMSRYGAISGAGWSAASIWQVYDLAATGNGPVRQAVQGLADGQQGPVLARQAKAMLSMLDNPGQALTRNASFEIGDNTAAADWTWWVKWETGSMGRSQDVAHSGTYSVLCSGMKRGGPVQVLPIEPGAYGLVCFAYTPPGQPSSGTVELSLVLKDAAGNNLHTESSMVTPVPGRWTVIAVAADVPERISGKAVTQVMPMPIINGFGETDKLYIDDLMLFRLPE